MTFLFRLAFRNVLRNRRRTLLTAFIIAMGLASLMFTDGLVRGMSVSLVEAATGTFLGHAQIHHPDFRRTREVEDSIRRSEEVLSSLEANPNVVAFSPRTVGSGMLSSAQNVAPVGIYGIDPEAEARVSKVKRAVIEGSYLPSSSLDSTSIDILIGRRLAQLLEVGLGDRVVLTAAQARTGGLSQELFRVSGIFAFGSREMDEGMVFIARPKAQELLSTPAGVHEIAVRLTEASLAERPGTFTSAVTGSGNEVASWAELVPAFKAQLEMSDLTLIIVGAILFGIVSLGVMNTLFMSLFERLFEFGVMKAVGTRTRSIAGLIFLEAVMIALFSIVLGLALGTAVTGWYSVHGLDFSGLDMNSIPFTDPIYTPLALDQYTKLPLFVLFITVVAAIYPAIHAARLVPAEAMRKSL